MYLTEVLAEHIATIAGRKPPPEVRDVVMRCILDLIGAALAGHRSNGPAAARQAAPKIFGSGRAPIWLAGQTSTSAGAIFCNAAAACALDIDDGHRAARGHPGSGVVTTALTLGAASGSGADDVIAAIVAGYDVGVRVAAAQNPSGIPTRQSGRWISMATAATAAALFKLEPPAVAEALSIAGVLAPNQQANGSSGYSTLTGNDVKEGIAWSSAAGVMAIELARYGHTGPLDLLDHSGFYDPHRILAGLGQRWEISETYFKPYACCRYIHPALDRLLELVERHHVKPGHIVSIDIQTFGWALRLGNRLEPENLVEVQYSLPYCVAIAIVDGADALLPITTACLRRPDLIDLAAKVRLSVHGDADHLFPSETLARVVIETRKTTLVSDLGGALGDPRMPLLWHGLEAKFRRLTRTTMTVSDQQAWLDAILTLAAGDEKPLFCELANNRQSIPVVQSSC
ncbi:MmgE/PrpD family protein [Rhizobium sp. S96]|uniref:MmgE/PrpD family protein n=1 Tax=Rhizobium sp. S96 TaxID=3055140 RepID=UPI0025AA5684|nr:MmgE/PrpD family protein [Rhizobium sp. S96]MDM9621897.1 MmgE/PrpD family protein [Rhizobium sp. S96]